MAIIHSSVPVVDNNSTKPFFSTQLFSLSVICVFVLVCRHFSIISSFIRRPPPSSLSGGVPHGNENTLAIKYLLVYSIAMAADWLQGPYAYRLYRHEYENSERGVALLFVLGFASAGVSANFVGKWADLYGRRFICLCFCASYSASCLLVLQKGHYGLLVIARILGGFSTSILFSVFETWLVAQANAINMSSSGLSSIFGTASLLNGLAAALAGLTSNALVNHYSSCKAPFVASAVALWIAAACIYYFWEENYGSNTTDDHQSQHRISNMFKDLRLLGIAMIQTLFESSMYLFVFQWVPTLEEAQTNDDPASTMELPLGIIFSFFMVSMMLGSQVYSYLCGDSTDSATQLPAKQVIALHSRLCAVMCAIAGTSLAYASTISNLASRFYGFALFEACVGMYFPVVGFLKSRLITDEDRRGYLTALLRLPLNIVVALILLTGFEEQRERVFVGITLMLVTASGISVIISD